MSPLSPNLAGEAENRYLIISAPDELTTQADRTNTGQADIIKHSKSYKITEKLTKELEMSLFCAILPLNKNYYFNGAF